MKSEQIEAIQGITFYYKVEKHGEIKSGTMKAESYGDVEITLLLYGCKIIELKALNQ